MAIQKLPIDNNDEKGKKSHVPDNLDVSTLRSQRERAFREVDFSSLAKQKSVNGYSFIPPPPIMDSTASTIIAAGSCRLKTPLIDISGGNNYANEGSTFNCNGYNDESNSISNSCNESNPNNPPLLLPPQAGLHRDGEQARIVELVRQRQLQQQSEESTLQWLEESFYQNYKSMEEFWASMLAYGGLSDDFARGQQQHHGHGGHNSTSSSLSNAVFNPYRDQSQPIGNKTQLNSLNNDSTPPSTNLCTIDDSYQPSAKHSRIIRFIIRLTCHVYRQILHASRWYIDIWITRLARLEPLTPYPSSSLYSATPVYSLQFSADDILRSSILLWFSMWYSSYTQMVAAPVVAVMCLLGVAVGWKVVGRVYSHKKQQQLQTPQLQYLNQSITKKMAEISTSTEKQSHIEAVKRLQEKHPNATQAECQRFLICVKHKEDEASQRLEAFLKWRFDCGLKVSVDEDRSSGVAKNAMGDTIKKHRREYGPELISDDEKDWKEAAKMAVAINGDKAVESYIILPQIICSYEERKFETDCDAHHEISHDNDKQSIQPIGSNNDRKQTPPRCKDGTSIFHILPARLDLSLATAPTYALACALYLDRRLSRSTTERLTLFCDVRGGRGWANPTPWSTLPFIQSTSSLLGQHYPERLERLVLFPMPKAAMWIWSAAQKCLDPNTASKVVVVGAAGEGGLSERLEEYIDEDDLKVLEGRRRSFFDD